MKCFIIYLTILLNIFHLNHCVKLDQVDDTDLVHLLTGEDNVITLFTKSNCEKCDELEEVVEQIQNELRELLNAVVVKAHNSQLVGIYDPSLEPSLIYFRRGIPLLYYGDINKDEILETFSDNRNPIVKELSDENFEHLTQAATGATTGDWFIFFYSVDCILCQRLYGVWEAVGAKLKRRVNVARVNRLDSGVSTAKRFAITSSPEFIYLRHGKNYRYKLKNYNPKSLIEFVEKGFLKQTQPEAVPPIQSSMDTFFEENLKVITSNKIFVLEISALIALVVIFMVLKLCKTQKPSKTNVSKKKK